MHTDDYAALGRDILQMCTTYKLQASLFGLSITVPPPFFATNIAPAGDVIDNFLIVVSVFIDGTQGAITIFRSLASRNAPTHQPVTSMSALDSVALGRDVLRVCAAHGLVVEDVGLRITLMGVVFDAFFANHTNELRAKALLDVALIIDGTPVTIQIMRRREVHPSMIMQPIP